MINNETLYDKIQEILNSKFNQPEKRKIEVHDKDMTFACPYCGDSQHDSRKKRGNLFYDTWFYHCYNCFIHSKWWRFQRNYQYFIQAVSCFTVDCHHISASGNGNL